MTDGVAVQKEEEELIDEGVEGYAPGLRGCASTVPLRGIQIITLQWQLKGQITMYFDII